jgi:hypothetical protein
MDNLKYAKICLFVGVLTAFILPGSVIYDQILTTRRRKENIIVDQDRVIKKLQENPNLKYRSELSIHPFDAKKFESIAEKD